MVYSLVGPSPQIWNQNSTGIADTAETGDGFGGGLDANGSKSAPGGLGGQDIAHLITADVELDSVLTKMNKRRFLSSRLNILIFCDVACPACGSITQDATAQRGTCAYTHHLFQRDEHDTAEKNSVIASDVPTWAIRSTGVARSSVLS